ncbi:MAG: PAS domain-containing protein [Elusimicrobiota bacterium]
MRIIRPVILLLDRMKYKQKTVLLGCVVLLPFIMTQCFLFRDLYDGVMFTRRERMGIEYVRPLMNLLRDVQRHRGMLSAIAGGDASFKDGLSAQEARIAADVAAVDRADRRLGSRLRTTGLWNALRRRIPALKTPVWRMYARGRRDEHDALIADILSLVTSVGNTSNLILDPYLDSYHLSNALITLLPALSEYMGQERAIGTAMAVAKGLPTQKHKLLVLRGRALAVVDMNANGFSSAFSQRPGLASRLAIPLERCHASVRAFQEIVWEKLIDVDRVGVKPDEYYRSATSAVDTVFELYALSASELDAVLAARIEKDKNRGLLSAAIALLALAAATLLFIALHVSIKLSISDMTRLAAGLASGDTGIRLEAAAQDELGDLARRLNGMAERVGEILQELDLRRKHAEIIISSVPAGLLALNSDLAVLWANRPFCEAFGVDGAELSRRPPLSDLLPVEGLREEVLGVLATGKTRFGLELGLCASDGSKRSFRITIAQTRLVEGEDQQRLLLVVEDISEKSRSSERITLQAAALDAAGESVVIADRDASIIFVNDAFCRQNGYVPTEVIGKNPRILASGRTDRETYRKMWKTILSGGIWKGEVVNRRRDGSLYDAALTIAPVREASGRISHYVAAHHDLTERHKAESQLRQAQKMESVGRLAGGVAHDFNNVLTTILGYSSFLLQNLKPDDPNRADVQEIKVGGERAAALTQQLLLFSRKQVVLPQRLDITGVVKQIKNMLGKLIGEDISLLFLPHDKPLEVNADKGQLEQVLMNLVVNARDAMPQGGRIVIETAPITLEKARIHRHGVVPPGSYVLLSVGDTGGGMSPEVQAHLFEPFFTTKEPGKGTGLGLSVIYGIVEQSGGFVEVDSEPGRGTAFKLYLPQASEGDARTQATAPEAALPTGTGTILVLEDETSVRELTRRALVQNGFTVLVAADPEQAIAICERRKEPIRLLLTDMVMPQMNGPEAARRISALHPETRILYMSGYTEHVALEEDLSKTEVAFLMKPFTPRVLLAKVHKTLGS